MRWSLTALLLLTAMVMGGCVGGEPEPLPPSEKQAAAPTAQVAPAATPAPAPVAAAPAASSPAAPADNKWAMPSTPAPEKPAAAEVEREKAQQGVGKRGRGYGMGLVATPIATYFSVQERMAFNKVIQAMQLYVAENNRPPKTQEEFMEKIIKAGMISLPDLRDGAKYVYLPEKVNLPDDTGLWVEEPKE
jgi:hypothetical protein